MRSTRANRPGMTAKEEPPSVAIDGDRVVVRYASAVDSSPCQDELPVSSIVQVILERTDSGGRPVVHWFLKHREGWTLHFNDEFIGAAAAISKLRSRLKFSVPKDSDIPGSGSEGVIVWQA